jgi:O-antigen ligase
VNRIFNGLPHAVVAWGVLAVGGVYPWAYYPLLALAFLSGAWELWRGRQCPGTAAPRAGIALGLLVCATALQLVPVPSFVRDALSPATGSILSQYSIGYGTAAAPAMHAFSVDPRATRLALIFIIALGTFMVGLIVRYEQRTTEDLGITVTVVGAVVAIAALVQRASGTEKIYGVWQPYVLTSVPFGPFVNRNHFAGWMLMALPFIVGSGVSGMRSGRKNAGVRATLVWLGSRDASWLALVAGVAAVMGVALALTLSRSGAATMVLILTVAFADVALRGTRRSRSAAACAAVLVVLVVGWGGTPALAARFADVSRGVQGRIAVWHDAIRVVRAFPLTGTGLNTYGAAMLFYQHADPATHYAQAHNDYLQLAAEGGLLVGVPALLVLIALGGAVAAAIERWGVDAARAGALFGLAGILLQESADFSLQIPANAVLFCALCAAAAGRKARADVPGGRTTVSGTGRPRGYNVSKDPHSRHGIRLKDDPRFAGIDFGRLDSDDLDRR